MRRRFSRHGEDIRRARKGIGVVCACLLALAFGAPAPAQTPSGILTDPADWPERYQQGQTAHEAEDYPAALRLLLPIAIDGHPPAQALIGRMLSLGQGVRLDRCAATHWFDKAARAGDPAGQQWLASSYAIKGTGVAADSGMAYYWLKHAEANGTYDVAARLHIYREAAERDGRLKWAMQLYETTPPHLLPPTEMFFIPDQAFRTEGLSEELFIERNMGSCSRR